MTALNIKIKQQIYNTDTPVSFNKTQLDKPSGQTITIFKGSKNEKPKQNIKADNTEVIEARGRMNE